jgi:hypothetical protein
MKGDTKRRKWEHAIRKTRYWRRRRKQRIIFVM